ncbi:MAG: M56 family metallopeptidase [Pirellulales bacterium]|nr:M56 family metallopeptidase [Pirellulales bacterium]
MTSFASGIVELAWTQTWQIALVAAATMAFSLTLGRRHAHLSYLLWMMVLVKALTPPLWTSPTGVFGWSGDAARVTSDPSLSRPVVDGARQSAPRAEAAPVAVDATVAPGASPAGAPWPEILLLVWAGGTLATLVLAGAAHRVVRRRWLRDSTEPSAAIADRLADVAARLGLRSSPRLCVAPAAAGPAVVGLVQPVIVLPESAYLAGEPDRLDAVLAHELVHLRRRDPAQSLVQLAAVAAWWWNPIVWLASRFATWERERCCDEEVLGTLGCPGRFYAQCLIDALRGPRRPLALGVPGALAALPVTRRRLRALVARRGAFPSRPPRWHWLVAAALGLLILPAGRAAERAVTPPEPAAKESGAETKKDAPPEGNAAFQAPELLYMAWQKDGFRSTGTQPIPHTLWDLNGNVLNKEAADGLLKKVGSFVVAYRHAERLRPLVLVFKVDDRISHCPVSPTVLVAGKEIGGGAMALTGPTNGLNLSAASPEKTDLPAWPDRISLEIDYPIDNVTVVKTITDVPDEPVILAPGVQWYLDPERARENDPETRGLRYTEGKTAGVLQTDRGVWQSARYEARVFLRGADKPLRGLYVTIIEPDGKECRIDVSLAFDNKAAIERVEFTQQRYAVRRIDNVPLRLDLLPKAEEEEADAGR